MPASAVRLAVPSVFDRLDGTVTLEARVTGNRDAPFIVGTGHLEGGIVSFIGYNQLFEGIRADAVISRDKIVFDHFEGRSGGGYIDGWGEVPLKMDAGQRLYFSVDFLDMRYPYPEDFRPVVQGHAELLGPEQSQKIRPWIQGYFFTSDDIRDEIDAVYDAGFCGYQFWNAQNNYGPAYAGMMKAAASRPERCR